MGGLDAGDGLAAAAGVVVYKEYGMLACCLGYIFYGLGRHVRRKPAPTGTVDSNPPM